LNVRPARPSDAADLLETDRLVLLDGRGQVRGPEELSTEARLREQLERGGVWVAEVDGRAVGQAEIHALGPSGCRHVAVLSLQVHPAHQGRGLGRALLGALVAHAEASGIGRLELYVRADNERAIGLYRSMHFAIECTRRAFVRRQDGSFVDDHVMVRWFAADMRPMRAVLGVWEGQLLVWQDPRLGWQLPALPEGAPLLGSLGAWTELGADGVVERWQGEVRAVEALPGCARLPFTPELVSAFPARAREVLLRGLAP
jgi:putative acetyltransferase